MTSRIVEFFRSGWKLGRQVKENVDGAAAAGVAYAGDAGLMGIALAFTGTTSAKADDLTPAAIMEKIDAAQAIAANLAVTLETGARFLELGSQTLAGAAHEMRTVEAFCARLKGGEPLRKVLEG